MTTITELQTKLKDIQAQIDVLKDGDKTWPQINNKYYILYANGVISSIIYDNDGAKDRFFSQGNAFLTLEDANREHDRRALIVELRKKANGFVPTWEGTAYCLNYDTNYNRWVWNCWGSLDVNPLSGYFAAPIDGLIEEFGSRLDLLRDAK